MMKRIYAILAALTFATAAYGQNAPVNNHAFAIGKGPTVQGYTSLLCTSAQLAVGQTAADPICRTVSGDATLSAAGALTLGTVNANVGTFGNASQCVTVTVNAKGLVTAISQQSCAGGGGGAPGGTAGQIQFNSAGAFGGFTASGDLTVNTSTGVFTFGTVNANVGAFGSATQCATVTVNAKGLVTAASQNLCTPAIASVTGLGTGIGAALAINVGSAGAPVLFNGAGGTPSSMVGTNITGTAAGLSIGGNAATATTASAAPLSGITGAGAGCITFLTTPSSANLRGCLTDESGTGLAYFQGGDIGTPSAGVGTNLTGTAAGLTAGTATNAVNSGITNDTTTNATMFPLWVTANTGNLPAKVTSTKLSFNPSTGTLSSTVFAGSGASLTAVPLSGLASQAANTLVANATAGAAAPTAVDISALTTKASPTVSDWILLSDQAASGALKKAAFPAAGAGTVTSVAAGGGIVASPSPIVGAGTVSLRQTTYQVFPPGTSGTYTSPATSKYIVAQFCGGGGGGSGSGTAATMGSGGNGTGSIFDTVTAGGGGGSASTGGGQAGAGGTITGTPDIAWPGSPGGGAQTILIGGFSPGITGAGSPLWGGATANATPPANSGAGGPSGLYNAVATGNTGGSGGSGACAEVVRAGAGAAYSYAIGASGSAGTAGTGGSVGIAGAAGRLVVREY